MEFLKSLVFIVCQMVRIVFHYNVWYKKRSKLMTKLPAFKKECLYYTVGNNFEFVYELKILFPNMSYGVINWKIFMWLCRLLIEPLAIYSMKQIDRTYQQRRRWFAWILPMCNIIFPIIDLWRYFFTSVIRPWSSNVFWFWVTQIPKCNRNKELGSLYFFSNAGIWRFLDILVFDKKKCLN